MTTNKTLDSKAAGRQNEMRLLEYLRRSGPIELSQISKAAKMGFSTVNAIISRLKEKSLITATPGSSSRRGAKPTVININPDAGYVVGVEVAPQSILFGLFDFSNTIIDTLEIPSDRSFSVEKIVEIIEINLLGFLSRHSIPKEKVLAAGITLSGTVTQDGVVKLSSPLGWRDVPLAKIISEKMDFFKIKIFPTRVRLLAELSLNRELASKNILYFNAGNGVGATLFQRGELLNGSCGLSGELGHIVIDKNGPLCGCGNRGCLEAFVSGPALAEALESKVAAHKNGTGELTPKKLLHKALSEKNADAELIFSEAAEKIAHILALAVNFIDPDVIILSGYVCELLEKYIKTAFTDALKREVYNNEVRNITLCRAKAGRNRLVSGAAAALLQDMDIVL